MTLRIERVATPEQLRRFVDAPYQLRRLEHLWVPPLRRDIEVLVDRRRHPFHKHAEVEYFLALEQDRVVGRIAAIENHAHNEHHQEKVGFFGMLDAEARPEVFSALLGAAEAWVRARGLTALRGPASFSTNEECGLLVHGFDAFPTLMTPWNLESWPRLVEGSGYHKAKDLWHWWVCEDTFDSPRMERVTTALRARLERAGGAITFRPLNPRRFEADLALVRQVYNAAWQKNWGFVPMTEDEIRFMAAELRPAVIPDTVVFALLGEEPVGFCMAMPDYNLILRHAQGSLLRALALFPLIRGSIHHVRVMTLGVVASQRNRGLETLLIWEVVKACRRHGFTGAELGWILEDNDAMNRILESLGGRHYRTHRIYEKALG